MSQKFNKLVTLLKELFQLDQPDLDFGLYRIMHAKSGEITQFLEEDLLPQIQTAFGEYKTADKVELEKELAKVIAGVEAAGMNPDDAPKVQELRTKLADEAVDIAGLESEVYDHLHSFFRRYYHEGDFLSKRVYKQGVYAIPYEGEEVKLHWANKDQYYIKTSEYLRDYAFRLRPENTAQPMRVHFKLVDASEGEHGNVKAAEGSDRVFILAAAGESGHDFLSIENDELSISFEYRGATKDDWTEETKAAATVAAKKKPPVQSVLLAQAAKAILETTQADFSEWIAELARKHAKADGEQADYTRLEANLRRYSARNTFDYFIHKDLGGFLKREMDFYIKNEVMHLDDIENESAPRAEQYLSKIKVIRKVAGKIITFLAQLEDFQKKLWLKKKFVVETNYCITLDRISEEFYPEIAANEAQREEWVKLFAIDEIEASTVSPAYTEPLTVEFLKANNNLIIDTKFYSQDTVFYIIDKIDNFDDTTQGLMIHSENFAALNTIRKKERNSVGCIYIDPPYNAKSSEIVYKNTYKHSSFLTFLHDRINASKDFLHKGGLINVAIDDYELRGSLYIMDEIFSHENFISNVVVQHNPRGRNDDKFYGTSHEYMIVYTNDSADAKLGFFDLSEADKAAYNKSDEISAYHEVPYTRTGNNSDRHTRPNLFYPIYVNTSDREFSLEATDDYIEVLPINNNGEEKTWRWSKDTFLERCKTEISFKETEEGIKLFKKRRLEGAGKKPKTIWNDSKYDASSSGIMFLRHYFGKTDDFSYPKSIFTVQDALQISMSKNDTVMDYFAGSGTTGHAVVNLNRKDGGKRKYILVEMGGYFDKVTKPRILKAVYSSSWKDSVPESRDTGVSHCFKYIRLESYEDALNNLEPRRNDTQQDLLTATTSQGPDGLKEQYMLRYMLDVESRGSSSLLNIQAFSDPTAYKLKVKRPGSDESKEVNVDLLETFNYLIGLTVEHIAVPLIFSTEFEKDSEERLQIKGRLKQDAEGPYWFRTVTGTTPDGQKTLVIWRKLTGIAEEDNLVLNEWFTKQGYSTKDSEYQLIYVNGDCTLENLKTSEQTWKVRLLEEDFHRLMFETEGL